MLSAICLGLVVGAAAGALCAVIEGLFIAHEEAKRRETNG